MALRLVAALWYFWYKRGHLSEGRRWLEEALVRSDAPTPARAEALNGAGALARDQADYEQAQRWLEESLVLRRELGDKKGTAEVLINLGTVAFDRGDYPRSTALEGESLSLWRELGDRWGIALALNNLGITMRAQGDLAEAAVPARGEPGSVRALEDTGGIALVLSNLGGVAEGRGEYAKAASFTGEPGSIPGAGREEGHRASDRPPRGDRTGPADYTRAAALYDESLRLHRELGNRLGSPRI
jgi:tetratricopeptide (TPR) repeat protein